VEKAPNKVKMSLKATLGLKIASHQHNLRYEGNLLGIQWWFGYLSKISLVLVLIKNRGALMKMLRMRK
jgi:hypothetical protein